MKSIDGDLVQLAQEGEFDVIAHGCNCFCRMGSGIAPQIANVFPGVREVDNNTAKGNKDKLGTFSLHIENMQVPELPGLHIYNLYTQFMYGTDYRKLNYEALYTSLELMATHLDVHYGHEKLFKDIKIGLPKIGCGLAGGSWPIVKEMIDIVLRPFDVTIVYYNK